MVVEFEEDDRALNTKIETVTFAEPTNPAEVSLVEVFFHLVEPCLQRPSRENSEEAGYDT